MAARRAKEVTLRAALAAAAVALGLVHFAAAAGAAPGDRDTSFGGGDGVATEYLGFGTGPDSAYAIAVQPDGKIVVAGSVGESQADGHRWALARFNPDGSPDADFGNEGFVLENPAGASRGFNAVALQPDGKIIAGGSINPPTGGESWVLARYTSSGSPDPDFGAPDGKVITSFTDDNSPWSELFALAIQPDGRIVAAGYDHWNHQNGAFARYNTDGSLDADTFENGQLHIGFNGDGKLVHGFGGASAIRSLALQPDGRIVFAGEVGSGPGASFLVGRLNQAGGFDGAFAGDGADLTDFAGGADSARSVLVQPSGRIVAGGWATANPGNTDFAVAAYDGATGQLDTNFGGAGKLATNFAGGDNFAALLQQPDGMLVGAGSSFDGATSDLALARWRSGGVLDPVFGSNGRVRPDLGTAHDDGYAAALQSDGKLLVAGHLGEGDGRDFMVARFEAAPAAGGTPGPAAPPAEVPGGSPADTTAPAVRVRLGRLSMRALVRRGRLPIRVAVSEPATLAVSAGLRPRGGRRARRTLRLATRTLVLRQAGRRRVDLRLTARARRTLRRLPAATARVTVRAKDVAGNGAQRRLRRTVR